MTFGYFLIYFFDLLEINGSQFRTKLVLLSQTINILKPHIYLMGF